MTGATEGGVGIKMGSMVDKKRVPQQQDRMSVSFSPPDISPEDIDAVVDVLRSGWITSGPVGERFRDALSNYCGSADTVLTNSATAALETALRALGVGPGDEVVVPAYTYTASASVVAHTGATIRMVDVQPGRFVPSPQQWAQAITERTKAIIPVDLAGYPVDTAELFGVLESHRHLFKPASDLQEALGRAAVIVDGAHSLGARRDGKRAGALGDFTAFSFHAVKNLTTAEGGALTWRKELPVGPELTRHVQQLILHGQTKTALEKSRGASWEYDIAFPGYKMNMPDITAALGLSQLGRYEQILRRRADLIKQYDTGLNGLPCTPYAHRGQGWTSSGHLYLLRLNGKDEAARNRFIDQMFERGVATNVHYKPLPMLTAYRQLGFGIAHYPNAYAQYANEVTLPLHTRLTDAQVQYVVECVREII